MTALRIAHRTLDLEPAEWALHAETVERYEGAGWKFRPASGRGVVAENGGRRVYDVSLSGLVAYLGAHHPLNDRKD